MVTEGYRQTQVGYFSIDFAKEDNPLYMLEGGMSEIKLIPEFYAGANPVGGNAKLWFEYLKRG